MKKLWNLVSIIAVVNLLAVLGFGGWLWSSGRMDKEKFRAVLAPPVPPAAPPEPTEEADIVPAGFTPTGVRIDAQDRQARREAQSLRRLHDEKQQLDRALDQRETQLSAEEQALKAQRSAWEASIAEVKAATTDEQFAKAVKLLESVPPKQGKELILELVSSGKRDEAVSYIDSMSAFKRSGLLKAFKGEEEMKVAAELLEAIRQRTPAARTAEQGDGTPSPTGPAEKDAAKPLNAAIPAGGSSGPGPSNADAPPRERSSSASADKRSPPATAEQGRKNPESGKPTANVGAEVDKPNGAKPEGKASGKN
jgi:hypothetical protein